MGLPGELGNRNLLTKRRNLSSYPREGRLKQEFFDVIIFLQRNIGTYSRAVYFFIHLLG
jgi:hypothetical protein